MVKNKKILIVGLANKYSIASSIAKSLHENGAKLGFSYQNERFEKFISTFAKENGNGFTEICDLSSDVDIKKLIERKKRNEQFKKDFFKKTGIDLNESFKNAGRTGGQ